MKVSNEEIEAGKSVRGGWTRKTLAGWGVPWRPPRGWRRALIAGRAIPKRKRRKFSNFHKRRGDLYWDRQWRDAMERDEK